MNFPFKRFVVSGESMNPTLKTGGRLIVYRWGKISAGDLIVFNQYGNTLVKRVVSKNNEKLEVRGDNHSDSVDYDDVTHDLVVGKVVATY